MPTPSPRSFRLLAVAGVAIAFSISAAPAVATAPSRTTGAVSADVAVDGAGATAVAAGRGSSCAIVGDGEVFCWGSNTAGQLGDGTQRRRLEPVPVGGLSGVVQIAVGDDHACALRADGTVACWGANAFGQLGNGTTAPSSVPVTVPALSGVTWIAAGRLHTCAVLADTTLSCWGANTRGQLGTGAALPGAPQLSPVPVVGVGGTGVLSGVTQVQAADAFHTCALLASGALACWGWNQYGQVGNGVQNDPFDGNRSTSTPTTVVGITNATTIAVAGAGNSCARLADASVRCWGWNTFGQLGQGGPAPGTIGNQTHSAIPLAVQGLPPVSSISTTSGTGQVCAVEESGQLWCWGHNGLGQLGDGSNAHQSLPVPIALGAVSLVSGGADHTCAITEGDVHCWGYNNEGQLGDGLTINRSSPTLVPFVERPHDAAPEVVAGISGATAIGVGGLHACALIGGGKVACWGDNTRGQLGDGTFTSHDAPVVVRGLSGATALAVGGDHNCAIVDGGLVCWGWNGVAQLGDGTLTNRSSPVAVAGLDAGVVAVAAGRSHTCAIVIGGEVRCWGHNYVGGPIGLTSGSQGGPILSATPVTVTENPAAPPSAQVPLTGATSVAIRGGHTCVGLADGTARCWGFGTDGQLGTGTFQAAGPTPLTPVGLTGVAAIAAGATHSCALVAGGEVRCWGQNTFGQVGDGTTAGRNVPTAVAGLTGASVLAAGADHSCAVAGGGVQCWGWNGSGQIGDATTTDATTPVAVPGLSGVAAVAAGWRTSCALTTGGEVRCWGLTFLTPRACDVTVTGSYTGPLTVTAGVTCLVGATVTGSVTVKDGAGLLADGARIIGPFKATGAHVVRVCSTRVTGPTSLRDGDSVTVGDPDVGCAPNRVTGPLTIDGTEGPSVVAGNRIVGPLGCAGNEPAPTNNGHLNEVVGPKKGQCDGL